MRLGVEAALVDGSIVPGDLEVDDGRVVAIGLARGRSGLAAPGFVDLQVNGFAGVDFATADAADYRRAGEALLTTGVTAFQPTLITAPEDDLVAALREVPQEPIGPRILGVHLEGPFLSPHRAARRLEPETRRRSVHAREERDDRNLRVASRSLECCRRLALVRTGRVGDCPARTVAELRVARHDVHHQVAVGFAQANHRDG